MNLYSDIERDARHEKTGAGSYEWWYFDGISEDGEYQLVIIYYDGYPFSTRYIQEIDRDGSPGATPDAHPAISISIYHKGRTIFQTHCQYPPGECSFDSRVPAATIGENSFRYSGRERHGSDDFAAYDLRINERLPSGGELKGIITFTGMQPNNRLFKDIPDSGARPPVPKKGAGTRKTGDKESGWPETGSRETGKKDAVGNKDGTRESGGAGHFWNLVLPRAQMQCRMNLLMNGLIRQELQFNGTGYHDHNAGNESFREGLRDWYRGRVHLPQATLVYNLMNKHDESDYRAWLISVDNRRLLHHPKLERMYRRRPNGYLLCPARRLVFRDDDIKLDLHCKQVLESESFSARYLCRVEMKHAGLEPVSGEGISEYIKPGRVHRRVFRPVLNMRTRYVDG